MTTQNIKTVAFVGTGVMGASMAGHLLDAGFGIRIFTRTASRAQGLVSRGATWCDSAGAAADGADVVITIVGYPHDVEQVYLGEGGIIERAKPGAILIDMTTSSPRLAARIAEVASVRGLDALDAPVSGGDLGAKAATLSIMVGGSQDALTRALPVLQKLGKNIVFQGKAGSGQHTKMCNQIAIAANMMGVCEALVYAQRAGLDPKVVLQSISGGAAASWSLTNLAPRILGGDYAPGFYIKHFIKDMSIALASADEMGLDLPALKLARSLYEKVAADGGADLGTQGLFKHYATHA
jgi:3-hydroxyisobutyrate dehydrogenase